MKPLLRKFLVVLLIQIWASIQIIAQSDRLERALITKLQSTTYHALLIGVNDYGDGSGISDLVNPVRDAQKLGSLLINKYHFYSKDVTLLPNSSRSEIIEQLESLAKRVGPEDNVLIFYAGHGKWDKKLEQGYWLPSDATIRTRGNWITNDDIRDYIKNIPSKHTLLISDACFSGGLLRTVEESREILELYNDKSRKAMTSGDLEPVPDNSPFLKYMMEELEENTKPFISADQLHIKLRRAVISNSPTFQKPLYGAIHEAGDKGGQFIFLRGKISPSASSQLINVTEITAPTLGISKSIISYGSIELTTEFSGALYLDGKLMGNVSANSKTPINKVTTGRHTLKIVGSETQTREVLVYKDSPAILYFKKKKEDFSAAVGAFTDNRNSKTYKWVGIGSQVWMAVNLNYSMAGSYVNKNGDRLYTWEAAMKACPAGWHLPSDQDWDILVNRFGGSDKAGAALKSTSGWKDGGNGTNLSGFNGIPMGIRTPGGIFSFIGRGGHFWSSYEKDARNSWVRTLGMSSSEVARWGGEKDYAYSCRCLRD